MHVGVTLLRRQWSSANETNTWTRNSSDLGVFVKKWLRICSDDVKAPAVMKEIDNLRKHMQKGCLSGIPSSFGTNRNENLHRMLNKRLAGNRLGVQLTVAHLSTFFHSWNLKRSGQETTSTLVCFMRLLQDTKKGCIEKASTFKRPSFPSKNNIGIEC